MLRCDAFSPDVIKHRFELDPLQLDEFGGMLVGSEFFLFAHAYKKVGVPCPLLCHIRRHLRRSGMKEFENRLLPHAAKAASRIEEISLSPMIHPAPVNGRIVRDLACDAVALIDGIRGIEQRTADKREERLVRDGSAIRQLAHGGFTNSNRRDGIGQFRRTQPFQQACIGKDSINEWRIAPHAVNSVRSRPLQAREFTALSLAFCRNQRKLNRSPGVLNDRDTRSDIPRGCTGGPPR